MVIDDPFDRTNLVYLGSGDKTNNVMENSDGNWNPCELLAMLGLPCNRTGLVGGRAISEAPSNMVEWEITGDTLADYGIGINNKEEDPALNPYGRPILGPGGTNTSVGAEYALGHAGAFYPAGDSNEDNQLTNPDFQAFRTAYEAAAPSTRTLSIEDFDGDGVITLSDFDVFVIGYTDAVAGNVDREGNGVGDLEDILVGRFSDDDQDGIPDEYRCVDPDSGADAPATRTTVTAYVTFDDGGKLPPAREFPYFPKVGTDRCLDATTLREFSCDVARQVTYTDTACASGCQDGACIQPAAPRPAMNTPKRSRKPIRAGE